MTYWIFKLADQTQYPDDHGRAYVFDNTHSVRVTPGDEFVYLDKRGGLYAFAGHGIIAKLRKRAPRKSELSRLMVRRIYTAILTEYIPYDPPVDISLRSREGRGNRLALGITDVNKQGWSGSVAPVHQSMFKRIVDRAYRIRRIAVSRPQPLDYEVPDTWSYSRTRHAQERFREAVLSRQNHTCAICGTTVREVLEVAHVSDYASDVGNRANPANGIGLCAFCHRAFDRGVFVITESGSVLFRTVERDSIAMAHADGISNEARLKLIDGVDGELLRRRLAEGQRT